MKFVALFQDTEDLEAGPDDARCEGIGEKIRTAPLAEKVDNLLAAGGKSAHCAAECLSESSRIDVNTSVCAGEFAYSVAGLTHYAC